jgi:xanthine phosphoribosyltransferase
MACAQFADQERRVPEPEFHYISHERFLVDLETIARLVEAEGWKPDFLIGIGRGGLVPAAYLSHRLGLPLLTVDHSTGEPGFGEELLEKLARKIKAGARMLIVDDINDSGGTITYLRAAIEARIDDAERLRVAVLVHNVRAGALAEYHGSEIDRSADKRWYVFPWEAVAPRKSLAADAAAVPERIA